MGEAGGSLTGKRVRCVDFSLTDLVRNSPATVLDHFSTGQVTVQTASGTVRSFRQEAVYELTGREKLPLPEKTPHCNKATEQQKTIFLPTKNKQSSRSPKPWLWVLPKTLDRHRLSKKKIYRLLYPCLSLKLVVLVANAEVRSLSLRKKPAQKETIILPNKNLKSSRSQRTWLWVLPKTL